MENNTSLETTDKTNIVTYGENAVGVLACSSPGESRTCVDAVDDEVCDSNSYEVISRADLKMNGGSITTNGINSYGTYANGNKAGNDSNLLIVFYVQIMPDDFVMQLHR
ncbi:hypothetical protein OFB80_22005, partial [Escherichia coli]|nr:hypothetical protein [Escherichia coli]